MRDGGQSEQEIIAQLGAVVANGTLSEAIRTRGEALLKRLRSPVRIAILGLPGTGKTELMNLIAGLRVVPSDVKFPSFELSHSNKIRCFTTDINEDEAPAKWPADPNFDWSGTTMERGGYSSLRLPTAVAQTTQRTPSDRRAQKLAR